MQPHIATLRQPVVKGRPACIAVPVCDGCSGMQVRELCQRYSVVLASPMAKSDRVRTDDGQTLACSSDLTAEHLRGCDGLVLVEGLSLDEDFFRRCLRDLPFGEHKVVGAIGRSIRFLAATNLARQRVASCPSDRSVLEQAGAKWVDSDVERHRHVVTSRREWSRFVAVFDNAIRDHHLARALVFSEWFLGRARSLVAKRGISYDLRDDFVHDIAIDLYRKIARGQYSDSQALRSPSYLTTAISRSIYSLQGREFRQAAWPLDGREDDTLRPARRTSDYGDAKRAAVLTAVHSLREPARSVMNLRWFAKWQVQDIAKKLDVSLKKVQRMMRAAEIEIRELVEQSTD